MQCLSINPSFDFSKIIFFKSLRTLWLKHVREEKKWGDKEIKRFLERNYDMTMKKIELPADDELFVPQPVGVVDLDQEEESTS